MRETIYGAPISAPFNGTGTIVLAAILVVFFVAHHFYQKDRLYWKAFWLYVAGIMMICDGFILPIVWFFFRIPGMAALGFFSISILAGLLVAWGMITLEDSMGNREQKLRGLIEEGWLMCIYGNLIGALFLVLYASEKFLRQKRPE